jgi:UMF1 family MFS transporter
MLAPFLGAVADLGSARKKFLIFFAYIGAVTTGALHWVGEGQWLLGISVYMIALLGFSGANIFYDSLLPDISTEDRMDRVSSLGYALGYLGGGLLFSINVLMTLRPGWFGLSGAQSAVRWSFLMVALWWGGFSLFTWLWVPEHAGGRATIREGFGQAFSRIGTTLRKAPRLKHLFLFLAAYWCYIDGVDTIIRMAVDYGLSLGFDTKDLILALLMVQFIGFPAALVFGRLGTRWGARRAIFLALSVYLAVSVYAAFMNRRIEFFILAAVIGCVQGGIQALSRSYYSRLIPQGQYAEFFGFYNMMGKFAAIIGPALMGIVGLTVRHLLIAPGLPPPQLSRIGDLAARWSIASVALLFIAGGILFYFVDEKTGRQEALDIVATDG